MKECTECKYFNGWDYYDGTPNCEYKGGYEQCPYCDSSSVIKKGMKIEIDSQFMSDYISSTIQNTIERSAINIATIEVQKIINQDIKDSVQKEMEEQIKEVVSKEIKDFLKKDIVVSDGWGSKQRTLTREEYLGECIEKELSNRFKNNDIQGIAEKTAKTAIDKFSKNLRDDINKNISNYFNEATRQILTENVVSLLMNNETYQRLSNSMSNLLTERSEK